jgi:hypothetical protein
LTEGTSRPQDQAIDIFGLVTEEGVSDVIARVFGLS